MRDMFQLNFDQFGGFPLEDAGLSSVATSFRLYCLACKIFWVPAPTLLSATADDFLASGGDTTTPPPSFRRWYFFSASEFH